MILKDLDKFDDGFDGNTWDNAISVGWIDPRDDSYTKGDTDNEIIKKIKYFNKHPLICSAGVHCCEYCGEHMEQPDEDAYSSNLLIIPDEKLDCVYFMPQGVIHYITKHNYKLPKVVEDAIFELELDSDVLRNKMNSVLRYNPRWSEYISTKSYKVMKFDEFLKT